MPLAVPLLELPGFGQIVVGGGAHREPVHAAVAQRHVPEPLAPAEGLAAVGQRDGGVGDAPPRPVAAVRGPGVAGVTAPDAAADPVGADQHVPVLEQPARAEVQRLAAEPLHPDARPDGVRGQVPQQGPVQVGAVHHPQIGEGGRRELGEPGAVRAAGAVRDGRRTVGHDLPHPLLEAERAEGRETVGEQRKSGAPGEETGGLLEDDHLGTGALQAGGHRQPADAGADDGDAQ